MAQRFADFSLTKPLSKAQARSSQRTNQYFLTCAEKRLEKFVRDFPSRRPLILALPTSEQVEVTVQDLPMLQKILAFLKSVKTNKKTKEQHMRGFNRANFCLNLQTLRVHLPAQAMPGTIDAGLAAAAEAHLVRLLWVFYYALYNDLPPVPARLIRGSNFQKVCDALVNAEARLWTEGCFTPDNKEAEKELSPKEVCDRFEDYLSCNRHVRPVEEMYDGDGMLIHEVRDCTWRFDQQSCEALPEDKWLATTLEVGTPTTETGCEAILSKPQCEMQFDDEGLRKCNYNKDKLSCETITDKVKKFNITFMQTLRTSQEVDEVLKSMWEAEERDIQHLERLARMEPAEMTARRLIAEQASSPDLKTKINRAATEPQKGLLTEKEKMPIFAHFQEEIDPEIAQLLGL